jgi:hypothetical protein
MYETLHAIQMQDTLHSTKSYQGYETRLYFMAYSAFAG